MKGGEVKNNNNIKKIIPVITLSKIDNFSMKK